MNNRPFVSVEYSLEKLKEYLEAKRDCRSNKQQKRRERTKANERGGLRSDRNAGVLHSIFKQ